jgi:hypothetical protein
MTGVTLDAQTRQPAAGAGARTQHVPVRAPLGVDLDDDGHALTIARTADTPAQRGRRPPEPLRRIAYDVTLEAGDAMRRIRDLFLDYDEGRQRDR